MTEVNLAAPTQEFQYGVWLTVTTYWDIWT